MDSERLRVALIGYGLAGEVFHAPLVAATPGLALSAIVSNDSGRRDRAAARYPEAQLLSSPEEVWSNRSRFDLVVVASPNRTHVPLALAAVQVGLAVVVDKPVAATVADAVALRDLAAARSVPVGVFQNRRWDGDFLTVRDLLDRGSLGLVHRFESRFERWRPEVARRAWRESPDPADAGGVLYDLGTHLVDQALVLFGPVASVHAEVRRVRPGAAVDDDTFIDLVHRSGTVSHLWASQAAADRGPRFRLLGRAAAFVKFGLDPQESGLRDGDDPASADWGSEPEEAWGWIEDGSTRRPVPTVPGRYASFYELMADAVRNGGPVPVTLDQAIETLRVIEAAMAGTR